MIELPEATKIHRFMRKEDFYKNLELTSTLKNKFISDIDKIYVENSLTMYNINLSKKSEIQEILFLLVLLKKKNFDEKIFEAIAKQNPHKLIFILKFENEIIFSVFHKKIYFSQWFPEEKISLSVNGFSLDEIWNSLLEQIVISDKRAITKNLSVDKQLELQEKILMLENQIQKFESAARKEVQPKKRFDLYSKVQTLKKELSILTWNA